MILRINHLETALPALDDKVEKHSTEFRDHREKLRRRDYFAYGFFLAMIFVAGSGTISLQKLIEWIRTLKLL